MTVPSFPPSSRRKIPELGDFLKNISPEDSAGPSLRYDALYDEIRLSRQEDDSRLSMGIWVTELKRADWGKIEDLCLDALLTKSKDLQISAWLAEAWTSLDTIEGFTRGILLISGLLQAFWKSIHPLPDPDGDLEKRYLIFEWMDNALAAKLMLIPLTQSKIDQSSLGLGFYKSAQHNDAALKRGEKQGSRTGRVDPAKNIGTVEEFQRSLEQTQDAFLLKQQENIGIAIETTQNFKISLADLTGEAAPSFSQILGNLKDMERICKTTLQTRAPEPTPEPIPEPTPEPSPEPMPEFDTILEAEIVPQPTDELVQETSPEVPETTESLPQPPEEPIAEEPIAAPAPPLEEPPAKANDHPISDINTREDAYRQLEVIATFLERNDSHSLAPQLLRQLIRWESKNIVDVLAEIAKTPQEYEILMRILGKPSE